MIKMPVSLDDVPNRQEIILFTLVILLGLVAFVRAFHLGQLAQGERLQSKLETLQQEKEALIKFEEAIQAKQALRKQVRKRAPNVRLQILAGERSPMVPDLTTLIGHITSDTFLQGLQLTSIKYEPLQQGGGFGYTVLEIQGAGRYHDVVEYLARLEGLEVLFNMEHLTLNSDEGGKLSFEWKAEYYEVGT